MNLRKFLQLLSVLLTLAIGAGRSVPAFAQDGQYVLETWSGTYQDVAIQWWDQKIVTVGSWLAGTTEGGIAVARYDFDGIPDGNFATGGLARPTLTGAYSAIGYGLTLQPDGKVVVAANIKTTAISSPGVVRLNANGLLDSGFGSSGWSSISTIGGLANKVDLQSNGKIVVAGTSGNGFVARFTANGALDTGKNGFGQSSKGKPQGYAFSPVPGTIYTGIAVQSDDKLIAQGFGSNTAVATRYISGGLIDPAYNGNSTVVFQGGTCFGAALQPDGKLVMAGGGGATGAADSDLLVVRLTSTGALDTQFGGGRGYALLDSGAHLFSETATDVAIQPDGKIVVAGHLSASPSDSSGNVMVARLNIDGTPDMSFGTNGFKTGGPTRSEGRAVDIQADGSIIVAGYAVVAKSGADVTYPLLIQFDP